MVSFKHLRRIVLLSGILLSIACNPETPVSPDNSGSSDTAVKSISVSPSNAELSIGSKLQLSATISPSNASGRTIIWSSSSASIADVSASGEVTAYSIGSATITAAIGDVKATCTVTVIGKEAAQAKDRETLIEFYNLMNGPQWLHQDGWCSNQSLEEWYGIGCKNGYVNSIFLPGIGVMGDFEKGLEILSGLSHLEGLFLQGNPLESIPAGIGKLKELRNLELWDCGLMGDIPDEIGELGKLEKLYLEENSGLTGSIPASIGNLKELQVLDVGCCQLSGPIPREIGQLQNLKTLNLSINNLSGSLPAEIAGLKQLELFSCSGNPLLSGPIPDAYSEMEFWNKGWGYVMFNTGLEFTEKSRPQCPPFSVTLLNGETCTSDILKGSSLTVLFQWATWCPFSIQIMPVVNSAYNHFKDKGLNIIGWSIETNKTDIQNYLANCEVTWPNFMYNGSNYIGGMEFGYPSGGIPAITAFDSNGNLVYSNYKTDQMESFYPFLARWFNDPDWDGWQEYESTDFSRDGNVTILQEATVGKGIDIVFLGDGFSDRLVENGKYAHTVYCAMEGLFSIEPYRTLRDMFNVKMVDVVSVNESIYDGADTALSTVWNGGTNVGGDDAKVIEYVSAAVSEDRMDDCMAIVLMNSSLYAGRCGYYEPAESNDWGSGFSIAYFPTGNGYLEYLVSHESGGHGFAKLDDEYFIDSGRIDNATVESLKEGAMKYGWHKNVDFTADPAAVKWSRLLQDSSYQNTDLGIFEGAYYYARGAYRPSRKSIMNARDDFYFNAPSREAIWYRAHKLAYGPDWEYNYEDFVKYDEINRGSATAVSKVRANYVMQSQPPLEPPVIHNYSWREVR